MKEFCDSMVLPGIWCEISFLNFEVPVNVKAQRAENAYTLSKRPFVGSTLGDAVFSSDHTLTERNSEIEQEHCMDDK